MIKSLDVSDVLTDLKAECSGFSHFVEDLLDQLDELRIEMEENSKQLEDERAQLAHSRSRLQKQRTKLASLSAEDGSINTKRIVELEHQRTELEDELELVRRRAAEMSDELARQQREIAMERAEWSGELRELRQILEQQTRVLEDGQQAAVIVPSPPVKTIRGTRQDTNANDPVINSVMAQFAKIQKDAARRREN